MRSTCASLRGRPPAGPSSRPPMLNPAATGAGQRAGSVTGAVREVHGLSLLTGRLRSPLALNIAGTTGPARTTPRRAARRSGRLLERPVDGAAADAQRPGDLGHGDVPGLV